MRIRSDSCPQTLSVLKSEQFNFLRAKKNYELRGTDNVRWQIFENIFWDKWRLSCLLSFKYLSQHAQFRKLGNNFGFFLSFSWEIFVTWRIYTSPTRAKILKGYLPSLGMRPRRLNSDKLLSKLLSRSIRQIPKPTRPVSSHLHEQDWSIRGAWAKTDMLYDVFVIQDLRNIRKHVPCFYPTSYRNTSRSLGDREMLWETEPQASVSTAFSSSPKLSRVFLIYRFRLA